MTAAVIRYRVDLDTGETISREVVGEKEIADGDYLRTMSRLVTGMDPDELADKLEVRFNRKGDLNGKGTEEAEGVYTGRGRDLLLHGVLGGSADRTRGLA